MTDKVASTGPKFVSMFAPVLRAIGELGGSARPQEVFDHVAKRLALDDEARTAQTASGELRHQNQMAWARFYLVRAGLVDSSKRGVWSLTEKGNAAGDLSLAQANDIFRTVRAATIRESKVAVPTKTPSDDDAVLGEVESPTSHRRRVLDLLQELPPSAFERFCQRLLREAGFQNVLVTGRSGDGGIDGIGMLEVNKLVSFRVLFQCKRWRDKVSPSQVRDFRGAMMGRADKGIVLTTGGFTGEARKEALRDGVPPIELVDGEKLLDMLEEYEIGLEPIRVHREVRVDEDFFASFARVVGDEHDTSR